MSVKGVLAPICTPFGENGDVNLDALRHNIARYIAAGLDGFVVSGTTGEAPLLSKDEKRLLYESVRNVAGDRILVAGTASESVRETLSLIETAADLNYVAALVLTPSFYRSQMSIPEMQCAFFSAVADSAKLPLLIYNFPQMTGIDLQLEVVQRLADHPNIIGIKESSADIEKIGRFASGLPAGFDILIGASPKFYASLCLGASGGILAIANVLPRSAQLIYDRFRSGDLQGAAALQQHIAEVAGLGARYGIQGLKHAMDLKGLFGGPSRPPLFPLAAPQRAEIEALLCVIDDEPSTLKREG